MSTRCVVEGQSRPPCARLRLLHALLRWLMPRLGGAGRDCESQHPDVGAARLPARRRPQAHQAPPGAPPPPPARSGCAELTRGARSPPPPPQAIVARAALPVLPRSVPITTAPVHPVRRCTNALSSAKRTASTSYPALAPHPLDHPRRALTRACGGAWVGGRLRSRLRPCPGGTSGTRTRSAPPSRASPTRAPRSEHPAARPRAPIRGQPGFPAATRRVVLRPGIVRRPRRVSPAVNVAICDVTWSARAKRGPPLQSTLGLQNHPGILSLALLP